MKSTTRIILAALLVLFGTSALPFEDGFEAQAAPKCTPAATLDLKDGLKPVLLKGEVCIEAGKATAPCERDALGVCKREASPLPPNPPTTGIPACTFPGIAGHPLVQPAGFKGYRKQWSDIQIGRDFPNGNAYLTPVGSYTLKALSPSTKGPSMAGKYIAVEFVAKAGQFPLLSWVNAQRQGQVPDYPVPRNAASMFVSISPCAGDLRPGSVFTSDPWLKYCRASSPSASLKFGVNSTCKLVDGQRYWITIAAVEPADGLTTTETTCTYRPSEGRCEVNMQAK